MYICSFNSRTREGCDSSSLSSSSTALCFNSRTREGCDRYASLQCYRACVFQFTHPGGVRHRDINLRRPTTEVSIHAPGRGATSILRLLPSPGLRFNSRTREGCDLKTVTEHIKETSFNSRTREGCDLKQLSIKLLKSVSIHAPGRGATVWCKVAYYGADKQA